jgi:hypothetical protein
LINDAVIAYTYAIKVILALQFFIPDGRGFFAKASILGVSLFCSDTDNFLNSCSIVLENSRIMLEV